MKRDLDFFPPRFCVFGYQFGERPVGGGGGGGATGRRLLQG